MVSEPPAESNRRDDHIKVPSSGSDGKDPGRRRPWHRTRQYLGRPENVVSLLTLVAVVVYTSLTYRLLNAERESYTRVQRAFVFPAEFVFRAERAERNVGINAVWRNGGDTPTRNLHISITGGRRKAPLPPDFDFPADDQAAYGGHSLPILVLGPHATASAIRPVEIPFGALADINNGSESVYLWGYARYDDIFGAPHLTRYCVQITAIDTDIAGAASDATGAYIPCQRGNCADEECTAEHIPFRG